MELIYIGECEHLENCCITDDKCLKRYIHIYNPKKGYTECLVFCNDYLKLKSQQQPKGFINWHSSNGVVYIVQLEIYKYLGLTGDGRGSCSKNIAKYYFPIDICQRPYTYVYITIKDMIEWYYEYPNIHLLREISIKIQDFLNKLPTQSSKTSHNKLISLSKKIDLCGGYSRGKSRCEEEQQSDLLELINETFKYTIKNN